MKYISKSLVALLTVVSLTTFVNVLVMYWIPIDMQLTSFFVIRNTFVAFMEKQYYLLSLSFLICAMLFLSIFSVRKKHLVLPTLSLLYLTFDAIFVLWLMFNNLKYNYWKVYVVHAIVLITLVVLLCMYIKTTCKFSFRKRWNPNNTTSGAS